MILTIVMVITNHYTHVYGRTLVLAYRPFSEKYTL